MCVYMRLTNSRFCLLMLKWTILKCNWWFHKDWLTPKYSEWPFILSIFSNENSKCQMECLQAYTVSLWYKNVCVLMYHHSKSIFLQVTLNFEMQKMNDSGRHSNSNLVHYFDFHCLTNFMKNIDLSDMASLWSNG